jgi:uncharacterized phage protein (TIGR01671 family)
LGTCIRPQATQAEHVPDSTQEESCSLESGFKGTSKAKEKQMSAPREVLFRAKDIDLSAWVEGCYAREAYDAFNVKYEEVIIDKYGYIHAIDRATLCQFTGLHDMNGGRIWENDIVERDISRWYENPMLFQQIVTWDVNGYSLEPTGVKHKTGKRKAPDEWSCDNVSVIGNIFDNPEMMEVSK